MNRRCLYHILLLVLAPLATALSQDSDSNAGGGNVWSRIIDHFDGTQTHTIKNGNSNTINEEKYDKSHVLVAKRMFVLDTKGRLRRGVIMDAKGNPLGSTEYGYDKYDRISEQRVYDTKARLTQRVFPPGTLAGVPQNAKHTITIFIDPLNPKNQKTMQTNEPLIQPVQKAEDQFVPGMPIGQPGTIDPGQKAAAPTVSAKPEGRKPSIFKDKRDR